MHQMLTIVFPQTDDVDHSVEEKEFKMLTIVFTILLGTDVVFALNVWGWNSTTSPWRPSLLRFPSFFPPATIRHLHFWFPIKIPIPPFPQLGLHFGEFWEVLIGWFHCIWSPPESIHLPGWVCVYSTGWFCEQVFFYVCFVPGSLRLDESVCKFFLWFVLYADHDKIN